MKDKDAENIKEENAPDEEALLNRRDFLVGLKKWSKIVIGGALAAGALAAPKDASAGSWINRRGGGAGWVNGGGGGWLNGGGGGWVNRRGGLGWINRR